MRNFREGESYFRLSFLDRSLMRPAVDTLIFIGMNLSTDDKEDTWYFQDAHSYNASGSAHESGAEDAQVFCHLKDDLGGMLDLPSLLQELNDILSRQRTG